MPRSTSLSAFFRRAAIAALLAVVSFGLSACSDGAAPPPAPTATAVPTNTSVPTSTQTAVPTSTSTPTQTVTPPPHEHAEILFGSTEPGGGALNTMYDEDHA